MAWRSYLKILTIAIVTPHLFSLLLWLGSFDILYVRLTFTASALGLFIVACSVMSVGFITMVAHPAHADLATTLKDFSLIYAWSTALPFGVSLMALSASSVIKPSFPVANSIEVVWLIIIASLALHALAMAWVLLRTRTRKQQTLQPPP